MWSRYSSWWFGLIRWFSAVPTWSSLNRLGRSKLVSLTVLVPFLGSLILFNQQLVDWVSLVPELAGSPGASRAVTLSRLAYAYFGLSFLGIASFLFLLFCPADVKAYGSLQAYVQGELPLLTRNRMGLLLYQISSTYLTNRTHGPVEVDHWWMHVAYPEEGLGHLFWRVFTATHLAVIEQNPELGFSPEQTSPPYFTDREEVDVAAIAEIFWTGRRIDRSVGELFADHAMKSPSDFLTISYLGQDHAKPILRTVVTACYALGFLILFIPTAQTFLLVLRRVIAF